MPQQPTTKGPAPHSANPKANGAQKDVPRDPELQNEGEGSRSAARRYDAEAERAAADPERVKELAKKAEEALDGPGGEELRAAEELGKKGSHK
jgi:hypothetical protein